MRGHRRPMRAVTNLDGCTLSDGTKGNGAVSAQVMRGHVWTTE